MVTITHKRFNDAVQFVKSSMTDLINSKLTEGKKPVPTRRDVEQILAPAFFDQQSHNVVASKLKSFPKTASGLLYRQEDEDVSNLADMLENLSYAVSKHNSFTKDSLKLQTMHLRMIEGRDLEVLPTGAKEVFEDMLNSIYDDRSFTEQGVNVEFKGIERVYPFSDKSAPWIGTVHNLDFLFLSEGLKIEVVGAKWIIGEGKSYCHLEPKILINHKPIEDLFSVTDAHKVESFVVKQFLPVVVEMGCDVTLPDLKGVSPETLYMLLKDAN